MDTHAPINPDFIPNPNSVANQPIQNQFNFNNNQQFILNQSESQTNNAFQYN